MSPSQPLDQSFRTTRLDPYQLPNLPLGLCLRKEDLARLHEVSFEAEAPRKRAEDLCAIPDTTFRTGDEIFGCDVYFRVRSQDSSFGQGQLPFLDEAKLIQNMSLNPVLCGFLSSAGSARGERVSAPASVRVDFPSARWSCGLTNSPSWCC